MVKGWIWVAIVATLSVYPSAQARRTSAGARGLVGSWILVGAARVDGPAPVPSPQPRGLIIFDAAGHVRSAGLQGSHVLSSLARANGLVDVPPHSTLPAGAVVQVLRWE